MAPIPGSKQMATTPKLKQMTSFPVFYKWAISADQFGKWFKGYNNSKVSSPSFGNGSIKFRLHLEYNNEQNKDLVLLELISTITDMQDGGDEPFSKDISVHYKLYTYGNSFTCDKPVKLLPGEPKIIWKTDYVFPSANPNKDKMISCELTVNKGGVLNGKSLSSSAEVAIEEGTGNTDWAEPMVERAISNSPAPELATKNSSISPNDSFLLENGETEQKFEPLPVEQSEVKNEVKNENGTVPSSTPVSSNTSAEPTGSDSPTKESNQIDILIKQLTQIQSMSHLADVIFTIGDKEFKAHKIILAARSPVFDALFSSESQVGPSKIAIDDIDSDVFQVLLNFIYTGDIGDIPKFPAELLVVAKKYNMECLIRECEQHLDVAITVENACKILHFAFQQAMPEVKAQTIAFIGEHIQEVIASDAYKEFVKPNAALLAELLESITRPSNQGNLSLN